MIKHRFYGWTLLGSLWAVLFLNLGFPAYGPAIINTAMATTLGLPREMLGNLFAVYMVMSGLPGPLVAWSVERFGVRRTLVAGCLFTVAGAALMATVVTTGIGGMLCFGLLVGAGVAAGGPLAAQVGLARWFVRRRALALSALYSASAFGGFVAPPLLHYLISANRDWRAGWWLLAALSMLAAAIALCFVRERPADLGQVADGIAAPTGGPVGADGRPPFMSRHEWTFREAAARPAYWLLVVALLPASGGYSLYIAHGVAHLQDLGHSALVGAFAISVLTISGLIAKLIIATLGDRMDPRHLWAGFMLMFSLGLLLAVGARTETRVYFFAGCIGVGYGGGYVCLMTVLGNYFGMRAYATLSGIAFALNTSISALVPKIAGRLYDAGYGYGGAFYSLAGMCFLGACLLVLIRRPEPLEAAATA